MEKRQLESTTSRDPAHKDGRWGIRGISNCLVSLYAQCRFTQLFPVLGVLQPHAASHALVSKSKRF